MGPAMPGGIPWRDVVSWCEFHDLTGDDVGFLDACVREMDSEYSAWYGEKMRQASAKQKGG